MGTAIRLGDDFDAALLRALAKTGRDANQIRRLLALAEIYDGGYRGSALAVSLRQLRKSERRQR